MKPYVKPHGRHVKPVKPVQFMKEKTRPLYFLINQPALAVLHACRAVLQKVLHGSTGFTRLPFKVCSPNSVCLRGSNDVSVPGANLGPFSRLVPVSVFVVPGTRFMRTRGTW